MLSLNNVEVVYSNVILTLRGVSLDVGENEIVALLGANGAGKTTTLKAISGLLKLELGKVTRGEISFNDKRIENGNPENIAKMGIVQVMEGRRIFAQLTAEENLRVGKQGSRDGGNMKELMDKVYHYFPRLKDLRNRQGGYLSGGEQQMAVIGRALMATPRLMLLDEASLGLAPLMTKEIFGIIKVIAADEKHSVLMVEQNVLAALFIAHRGFVMENGKIVLDGSAEALLKNEDVREFYLGLSQLGEKTSYRQVKHYKRRKRWLG